MPKVLISDKLSPRAAMIFEEHGIDVDVKPGFIGDLGTLCGKHGLNIATFHLGRREAGGEAIALAEIDGGLPKTMLPEIRALDQVVRADALHFALDI